MPRHSTFATRLSLYVGGLLLASVIGMTLVWWFGLPGIDEGGVVAERQHDVQQHLELRADFLRRLLVQGLAERRSAVRELAYSEALARSLANPSAPQAMEVASTLLDAWINEHPGAFQHVQVLHAKSGLVVASMSPVEVGTQFADATLLQRARQPGAQELILPNTLAKSTPSLAWVRQLTAPTPQGAPAVVGIIVAHAQVQDLLADLLEPRGATLSPTQQSLVFDSQQRLLANLPARSPAGGAVRIEPEVNQGFEGTLVRTPQQGEPYLAVYRSVPLGGTHAWTLVEMQALSDIRDSAHRDLLRDMAVLLVGCLLFGVVLWMTARLATRRLLSVSRAFGRLAQGELELRQVPRPGDSREIVTLLEAFNQLAEAIQASSTLMEQQVAERTAELAQERDRARGYLDVAGIMLMTLDRQGCISLVNRKGAELLGFPAAQLPGMDWFLHFIAAAQRETQRSEYLRILRGLAPLPARSESELVDANGRTRIIVWHAVMLYDREGNASGVLYSGQDVTDSRAAQAELRIAAIAFESQEPHMVCDAQWAILRVNRAFSRMTGYSAQEAVGKLPSRLLGSERTPPAFYAAMEQELPRQGSWQGEVWDRRKDGDLVPVWLQVTAVRDEAQQLTHYVVALNDITERKAAEEQIRNLAFYDPLTNLPNRRLLMDRLEVALATCARHPRRGALLFIDLDNFKTLNDTMGHDIGDLLLQQVAERLKSCVREGDTVARLGGDEFVVMLEDLSDNTVEAATQAEVVGEKVLQSLGRSYILRGHTHRSTPSIGVTLFGERIESIEEPLKRADVAMYQSKAAGRNTLRFFDPTMQAAVAERMELEADLRIAIEQAQLELFYQPQIQARADGELRVIGAEALVRWKHPERGMISPADFIPLAEETGLVVPLGQWVIETACRQLATWHGHPVFGELTLAVNVSARQFLQGDFVSHVRQTLEATGAQPPLLKIELTESTLVGDIEEVVKKMAELQSWGVGFALDDFGTGYSSLAYLKRLPLDSLKIDQSFVRDIFEDANDAAIARMVVVLGRSLGLTVIAEGVESLEQRYFLAQQGCHVYQGYLFGRPQPLMAFQQAVLDKAYLVG